MDESPDQTPNPSQDTNNVVDLQSPTQKIPRRRFVQSTLFPLKPHDKKIDNSAKKEVKKVEEINVVDVDKIDVDDDVVECVGSQSGKKKRCRPPKQNSTPQKRRSKKTADNGNADIVVTIDDTESPDEGSPQLQKQNQRTPTRNGKANCNKRTSMVKTPSRPVADQGVKQPIPDLWQEARRTAEENSRIFAGKQIHPFFSSLKAGKKDQENGEVECIGSLDKMKRNYTELGPIHVIDDAKDNLNLMDWSKWNIYDAPFSETSFWDKDLNYSKGNVGPSNFNTTSILNPCGTSLPLRNASSSQSLDAHDHTSAIAATAYPIMVDEEVMPFDLLQKIEKEPEVNELHCLGGGVNDGIKSELKHNLLHERMISYHLNRGKHPENSMWTNKYQPEKASEVCGNSDAVKFINDWLRLWHAADLHFSKISHKSDSFIVEDDEYESSDSDSETGNDNVASDLKNVLLVSGPVGSGKSAAIYACAKELGFQVIEVNASDWRNGALLKQKFGEAVGLHWLKRSQENPLGSQSELNSPAALRNGGQAFDLNNPVTEVISLSEEEDSLTSAGIQCRNDSRISSDQGEIKTLILFEDVDATLCEDRGFISTIQQLADTAKRPMILTSNSDNPDLPDNLDREEICFSMPSLKELIHHIYLVCASEQANIQPHLIERCIEFCGRDIRKTLMHLQFWCQRKTCTKEAKLQSKHCPLMFSLEAAHCTLPKLIPWELPSALSEIVEAETASSLCTVEEDHCYLDVIQEDNMHNDLVFDKGETGSIEAKKEAIIRGNCFVHVDNDDVSVSSMCEFSDSPIAISRRRNVRRKLDTVFSDSEEELPGHERPAVLNDVSSDLDKNLVARVELPFPISIPGLEGTSNAVGDHLPLHVARKVEETTHQPSDMVNANHINHLGMSDLSNQATNIFGNCQDVNISERKHQCLQLLDLNSSFLEEPRELRNLFNEQLFNAGQQQMEDNGDHFQWKISATDTPINHSMVQSTDVQEMLAETDSQIAVGPHPDKLDDHLQLCTETKSAVARSLFSHTRLADPISCKIESSKSLSPDTLIHCREVNMAEFQDCRLEMGNGNNWKQGEVYDCMNPLFGQVSCSKANVDNVEPKQPDIASLNLFSYPKLDRSWNPSSEHLVCSSEAGAQSYKACTSVGDPLSQSSDKHLGTAKLAVIQLQDSGSAGVDDSPCLLVDDSLKQDRMKQLGSFLDQSSNIDYTCLADANSMSLSGEQAPLVVEAKAKGLQHQYSEAAGGSHLFDQCFSADVSCVPESTYVPETEVNDETNFQLGTDQNDIVSPLTIVNMGTPILRQEAIETVPYDSGINVNVSNEQMGDSHSESEHLEASTSGCQVMDECSRMDFCKKFRRLKSVLEAKNPVKERWNELRLMDLGQYLNSEHEYALQVLDHVCGASNLISEGDLLLRDCGFLLMDSSNDSGLNEEETVTFGWPEQQVQMAMAILERGYWLFADDSDALQSKMGTNCRLHLSWEMLTSTNNSITLGKLLRLNKSMRQTSFAERSTELPPATVDTVFMRDRKTCLQNIAQSVAPLRSCLALRRNVHEYLSSLSQIARSESSRLTETPEKTKRRRVRAAKNYLSSGKLDLSPDDITMLNSYHSYGKTSSKSPLEHS